MKPIAHRIKRIKPTKGTPIVGYYSEDYRVCFRLYGPPVSARGYVGDRVRDDIYSPVVKSIGGQKDENGLQ